MKMVNRRYVGKSGAWYCMSVYDRRLMVDYFKSIGYTDKEVASEFGVDKTVIRKTKKAKPIKRRLLSPEEIQPKVVGVYFKLEDYGEFGHEIWISCWEKQAFSADTEDKIIQRWVTETKGMMLDNILNYMGEWLYSVDDWEFGVEEEREMVDEYYHDSKYRYSHDGSFWRDMLI